MLQHDSSVQEDEINKKSLTRCCFTLWPTLPECLCYESSVSTLSAEHASDFRKLVFQRDMYPTSRVYSRFAKAIPNRGSATSQISQLYACAYSRKSQHRRPLYSTIPSSTPSPLHSPNNIPRPILHNIRHIPYSITMRYQIPASCSIPVIIQPGSKDDVCCC